MDTGRVTEKSTSKVTSYGVLSIDQVWIITDENRAEKFINNMIPSNLFADPFNITRNISYHIFGVSVNMTCSSHSSLCSLLLSSAALMASVLVNQLLGASYSDYF